MSFNKTNGGVSLISQIKNRFLNVKESIFLCCSFLNVVNPYFPDVIPGTRNPI